MAEEENEAPETAPENTAEPAESSSEIGANRFLVKERYEIDYAQPLPWLDSNGAKAFRVIDRIDTKRGLCPALQQRHLPALDHSSLCQIHRMPQPDETCRIRHRYLAARKVAQSGSHL